MCDQQILIPSVLDRSYLIVEDSYAGGKCNYAVCINRRLLTDDVCSMIMMDKSKERIFPITIEDPVFHIRGKTF